MLIMLTMLLIGLWTSAGDANTLRRKPQSETAGESFKIRPLPMNVGFQMPFGISETQTHSGGQLRTFKYLSAAAFGYDGGILLPKFSIPYHMDVDWSGYRGVVGVWGLRSDFAIRFDAVWRLGSFSLSPKAGLQYLTKTLVSGSRYRLEPETYHGLNFLGGLEARHPDWFLSAQLLASPLTWSFMTAGGKQRVTYHLMAGLDLLGAYRLFSPVYVSTEVRLQAASGVSGFLSTEVRLGAFVRFLDPS
jgi:hypothetical protein